MAFLRRKQSRFTYRKRLYGPSVWTPKGYRRVIRHWR